MKKSAIVLFFAALLTIQAFAQSVQDGINHFYAERYQSAKSAFDKLVSSNPNNMEAVYWLGQTYLDQDDVAGARAVYEKALAANGNAPLALVGMGHVELLEGKAAEAKQRFETAISVSKGRKGEDPNVLNAIGRANVEAYTEKDKRGDLDYAIAKLNDAAKLAPNNASIYLNLGNAYRKKHNGGQAITNYMKATQVDAKFAEPYYRMATLYKTQQNWDIVTENLNKAVAADPKFAPAYLELYYYYLLYPKDFAKAEDFANKYVSNSDPSVENDYLKAQTAFVQKKYDEAISLGKNIVATAGEKAKPRVYRLLGYSFVEKGDSTAACQYVGQFFAKAKDEDIVGGDYILQADACGKDNPAIVKESYYKAVMMDSVLTNQLKMINEGIERFKNAGKKSYEADLRLLSYQLRDSAKAQPNPTELISYIAVPYYQGGEYAKADSISKMYSAVAPDSIYGYLWSARSLAQMDTTMEQGLAIPTYEKLLEVASTDKVRFKSYGVEAAGYLGGYHNNVKKDKDMAITFFKRGLEFDPENTNLQRYISILSKPSAPPAKKPETKIKSEKGSVKVKTGK
jgi:tetratricopeptide (TPR) repeat protein